jgi:hypothetical protein
MGITVPRKIGFFDITWSDVPSSKESKDKTPAYSAYGFAVQKRSWGETYRILYTHSNNEQYRIAEADDLSEILIDWNRLQEEVSVRMLKCRAVPL